jgi:hypothetical protein
MKGTDFSSPTHRLSSLREDCTSGQHQNIEVDTTWATYFWNFNAETVWRLCRLFLKQILSLFRTYCLCPELIVSVQNLLSLSRNYRLCPDLSVSVHNLLSLSRTHCLCPELIVCEMCIRLMNNMKFQKDNPRWDLEKFCGRRQKVQDTLEEKLRGFEWKTGNVEILCYNIKKCVLDTMSGLVGKVDR